MNEMDKRAVARIKELERQLEYAYIVISIKDEDVAERDERIANLVAELSRANADREYAPAADVG